MGQFLKCVRAHNTQYTNLKSLRRYVTEPRYSQLLVGVTECMLDVYGSVIGQSQKVDKKLQILQERILVEVCCSFAFLTLLCRHILFARVY